MKSQRGYAWSHLFIGMVVAFWFIGTLAWADPPEGKGKDNAPGQEKKAEQGGGNGNGNGNGNAGGNSGGNGNAGGNSGGNGNAGGNSGGNADRGNSAAARAVERGGGNADNVRTDRTHPHADRAADRAADRGSTASARADSDSVRPSVTGLNRPLDRPDHAMHMGERAVQVASLLGNLNALHGNDNTLHGNDNAKWWKHPFDTRTHQGNAGKVRMQSPFGFDKDSGREGRARGRPYQEVEPVPEPEAPPVVEEPPVAAEPPVVAEPPVTEEHTVATCAVESPAVGWVSADFSLLEDNDPGLLAWMQVWMDWYTSLPADDPFKAQYTYEQYYQQTYDHFFIRTADTTGLVNNRWENLAYQLNLTQDGTYTVTTELVALQDYSSMDYQDDPAGALKEYTQGQVIWHDTSEVTVTSGAGTFSYDNALPDYTTWETGLNTMLHVTITNTATGESTTICYDKQLYLYRCPYGVVYDKKTGTAIAGAVVTIHDAATGAIIALDKGANPHQSNPQTTDATGRYDCKLQIGRQYYVTVKAPGFEEYQSPVFSERWHVVREDVPLEKVQSVAQK